MYLSSSHFCVARYIWNVPRKNRITIKMNRTVLRINCEVLRTMEDVSPRVMYATLQTDMSSSGATDTGRYRKGGHESVDFIRGYLGHNLT